MRSAMLAVSVCLMLFGCGGTKEPGTEPIEETTTKPVDGNKKPIDGTPTPEPETKPTFSARVFVDTSGSMAGFFGKVKGQKDSGKMLIAVHAELDAAVSELGLGAAKKCTVGITVACEGAPQSPSELGTSKLYTENGSRLDSVLVRIPVPNKIDPNKPLSPDYLDDAKITLLVTDGMQAAAGASGANESPCAKGADPTCVASLLRQRINEGFGVWIVGVLLPFNGTHYPERSLIDSYFTEARGHVDELKFDARNLGVEFSLGKTLGKEKNGNSNYTYQGYKPILFFVFSRDAKLGRSFVDTLSKKLASAPIQPGKMKSEDTVKSIELAPLTSTGRKLTAVELAPKEEQKEIDPAKIAEFKLKGSAPIDGGLSAGVWCGANGQAMLNVTYETTGGSVLPAYFTEEVVLTAGSAP